MIIKVTKTLSLLCVLFFGGLATSYGQIDTLKDNKASCRAVVESFYNWYITKIFAGNEGWITPVLENHTFTFSTELREAITHYRDLHNGDGDLVGLDFDPFLHAQDNADHYIFGPANQKGNRCLVDVYGIWADKKAKKPDVIPELIWHDGQWVFADFRYDITGKSLLAVLRTFQRGKRRQ